MLTWKGKINNIKTFLKLKALFLAGCCYLGNGLPNAHPSNILAFLPTETKSHFNGFKPLLEELVIRGHNLTLVSPYPLSSTAVDGSQLIYKYIQVETEEVKMGKWITKKQKIKISTFKFVMFLFILLNNKVFLMIENYVKFYSLKSYTVSKMNF